MTAPPDAVSFGGSYAYPGDGSVVSTGSLTASASASTATVRVVATATGEVQGLSLFGGEITASRVATAARASSEPGSSTGDVAGAAVEGLVVLGQSVDAAPGSQIALADWGTATVLGQSAGPAGEGFRAAVTGLTVTLTAEHGGLPAGSSIVVGFAEATAVALAPPPSTTAPTESTETVPAPPKPRTEPRKPPASIPPLVRRPPPGIAPRFTRAGYVFPVYGPASYIDSFRAGRANTGWHHGADIFAIRGAPVLAITAGTLFSVGWNDVGGNRLWIRDRKGNEYYYAHMQGFSPLAVNGAQVRAGDVVGFVGNSGDAQTTPTHLHFEIHPLELLSLGYDGVINPTEALDAWRRLEDVGFLGGSWVLGIGRPSSAPAPGAYLLSADDISSASGLHPGSLRHALAEPPAETEEAP